MRVEYEYRCQLRHPSKHRVPQTSCPGDEFSSDSDLVVHVPSRRVGGPVTWRRVVPAVPHCCTHTSHVSARRQHRHQGILIGHRHRSRQPTPWAALLLIKRDGRVIRVTGPVFFASFPLCTGLTLHRTVDSSGA